MKIVFPCHDHDFKLGMESGAINGGTATLYHYAEAFKKLGWEAELCEYSDHLPDADVYLIQSEWYAAQKDFFEKKRKEGNLTSDCCNADFNPWGREKEEGIWREQCLKCGEECEVSYKSPKVIVWLGHWIGGKGYPYYDPKLIEADLFITTWKGEVVKKYEEETGKKVHYVPHAYGCDNGGRVEQGIVFAGNTYALRDEGIIEGVPVERLSGIHPASMPAHYRGASIALNFHGKFQKNEVSKDPSTLANEPGLALNERTFQTSGAGGFQMCQEHPLLKDIFPNNEIITFTDNQDLKEKIAYWLPREQERKEMAEKAREVILKDHTYLKRANNILYLLNQ